MKHSGDTPIETVASWVEQHTEKLLSWAYYKVSDKDIAKDLVQDTFLAAVQAFHQFKGESNPKTWLLSILNNKIIDYYRKQSNNPVFALSENDQDFFNEHGEWKKEHRPEVWDFSNPHLLDNAAFNDTLKACMDKLPATWFASLQLKYIENRDGKEICQELCITQSNFWQILHRAKLQLRDCLEKHWFKK